MPNKNAVCTTSGCGTIGRWLLRLHHISGSSSHENCNCNIWKSKKPIELKVCVGLEFPNLVQAGGTHGLIHILGVNFENLTVEFYVPYVLNIRIKFRSNWMLFTIWSINLFFIYNFRSQKLEIITFIWWFSNWSMIFLKFYKN